MEHVSLIKVFTSFAMMGAEWVMWVLIALSILSIAVAIDLALYHRAMKEDVGKLAPEAGNLLTAAFPSLTLDQANQILTETEGPGGGFLDDGSAFGVYSRLNLYAAAGRAKQMSNGK